MFGNRNKNAPIDSLIGAGTTIEGDVRFRGGLRIDGMVKGKVLGQADAVLLTEVYAAGEAPIVAADGRALARAAGGRQGRSGVR